MILAPLSNGLQAVLKRRNSKVHREPADRVSDGGGGDGGSNRGSRSSLTLPIVIRRFSSTETLSSASQRTSGGGGGGGDDGGGGSEVGKRVTRRRSFSRRVRKSSPGSIGRPERDACMDLDISIAKIKRKLAQFRKEDMEISERVEDLTTSLTGLCHDYRVPIISPPHAHKRQLHKTGSNATSNCTTDSEEEGEEEDEEEFKKFCQSHRNLLRTPVILIDHETTEKHNTLPELPRLPGTHISSDLLKHSHSNRKEGGASKKWTSNSLYHLPRNSYPQDKDCRTYRSCNIQDRVVYPRSYHNYNHSRPFSYQDIAYEETDFDETPPLQESWNELSCP